MGNGMNRVLPGLYVGNFRDSKDCTQLDRYNITHIVAIHDAARKIYPDKHYLCVMASDTPDQNLVQYFSVCNDFIHAARLRGGNVLIHCLAGMSRSVTVCVAYIMAVTSLNWKEALKVVRVGRSVANPNLGFQRQLEEFEITKLYEERRRLKERFPSVALIQRDEQECRLLLSSYDDLLLSKQVCEGNCAMGEECPTGICRSPTKSRDVALRRKSSIGRNTPPSSPRRLPPTPLGRSPSVTSAYSVGALTRGSALSRVGRLGNSAPPSPSVSRHDLLSPSLSAPVSPSRRSILSPRPPLLQPAAYNSAQSPIPIRQQSLSSGYQRSTANPFHPAPTRRRFDLDNNSVYPSTNAHSTYKPEHYPPSYLYNINATDRKYNRTRKSSIRNNSDYLTDNNRYRRSTVFNVNEMDRFKQKFYSSAETCLYSKSQQDRLSHGSYLKSSSETDYMRTDKNKLESALNKKDPRSCFSKTNHLSSSRYSEMNVNAHTYNNAYNNKLHPHRRYSETNAPLINRNTISPRQAFNDTYKDYETFENRDIGSIRRGHEPYWRDDAETQDLSPTSSKMLPKPDLSKNLESTSDLNKTFEKVMIPSDNQDQSKPSRNTLSLPALPDKYKLQRILDTSSRPADANRNPDSDNLSSPSTSLPDWDIKSNINAIISKYKLVKSNSTSMLSKYLLPHLCSNDPSVSK